MATTVTSATMTITLTETVTLAGVKRGSSNAISVAGVNELSQRVVTVPLTATDATTTTTLVQLGATPNAGQWVTADTKYIRITNLDDTTACRVKIASGAQTEWHQLDAGTSMMWFNLKIIANDDSSNFTVGTTTLSDIASISAQCDGANVDVEVLVASA